MKRAHSPRRDPAAAPVRPTRVFHLLAGLSARRLRGLSLLASLSLALVVSSLALWSVVPAWNVLVALAVLVSDVAWLRHVAVSERAGQAHARSREPVAGPLRHADGQTGYFEFDFEPASETQPEPEQAVEPEPVVQAPVAADAQTAGPIDPSVEVDPSGWEPVPVPPPTYTLKARAADPVTAPNAVTEHLTGEPWSLEGMVYDCDLDELVERRSATGA